MVPSAVVDERFRRRRVQNWVFLGLMYAMFYMARYNLSVADPYLLKAFGWTKEDLGILKSAGVVDSRREGRIRFGAISPRSDLAARIPGRLESFLYGQDRTPSFIAYLSIRGTKVLD